MLPMFSTRTIPCTPFEFYQIFLPRALYRFSERPLHDIAGGKYAADRHRPPRPQTPVAGDIVRSTSPGAQSVFPKRHATERSCRVVILIAG